MKKQVSDIIERLKEVAFFGEVGKPLGHHYLTARSWKDAMAKCKSIEWEGAQMEARNLLSRQLAVEHSAQFQRWNDRVMEIRPVIAMLVADKVRNVVREYAFPKRFEDSVRWDILNWMMELEYSDLVEPKFYSELGSLYLAGHFPCGWTGEFPVGGLIVY